MFEKILVPLDGSEYSLRALNEAVKLAKIVKGSITLIHVYSTMSSFALTSREDEHVRALYEIERKNGRKILLKGIKIVKAEGVKVDSLLPEGDAVDKIVRTAKEGDFKLIVIGARGVSKLKECLLGSVSDGVIRNTSCPVLVVR